MVPVQHHRREPAAGASCDRCRAHPHDHTPAGQGKTHNNYPSLILEPRLSFVMVQCRMRQSAFFFVLITQNGVPSFLQISARVLVSREILVHRKRQHGPSAT